ncbi:T9SS type A sorting domain-containing protein [Dyadobacter flavalbus]|uniref:T9SS type A sorting domain-containing protein n=1 Tax=Dyadobacter flavalbus TaxID=2579942 RepID=A0A5M8R113_9BACT|nr:C25 family cysteine peptidase [Dyadobacter flavalbus]KAA6440646.1 T9SS type A sorting domain-containing protein [Dyadobacter flavalbus]
MKTKNFTRFIFLLAVCIQVQITAGKAQTPWSGKYGNEWLEGKYGQSWLRIGVSKNGIYKVALPAAFQNKPNLLHLYHRGVEVALVSATNTEIEFYGVLNDGASDALLYRLPTSRKNTNFSIYSDESAYFLTFDSTPRTATVQVSLVPDQTVTPQQFHYATYFKEFTIENSHMTTYPSRPATLNSYFEEGKAGTGTRIANNSADIKTSNPKPVIFSNSYVAEPFIYQLNSRFGSAAPKVNVRLKGRGFLFSATSNVGIYAGKDNTPASLRLTGSTTVTGFLDQDYNFELQETDIENGQGTLGFKSTGGASDGFSVSYYSVTYEQKIDMQGANSYEFNFPAFNSNTRFTILNTPAGNLRFLDITDADHPRIINGNASDLMVSRNGGVMKLLASNESTTVTPSSVTFQQINPADFDYLIVTNETLSSGAQTYADYRKNESPGKKYKPIVKKITDVYNQFNYGEPSAVAIRRFVDFMISDENKDKYLLLLGKSITYYERSTREIPDEVPTVGFPASDLLLVDGLGGTPDDVPSIPYGRISAITNQQLIDYLNKVKTYESQTDVSWRKNVLHLSGGKGNLQVQEFAKNLSDIASASNLTNAPYYGKVIAMPKALDLATNAIQEISIAPYVNGTIDPSVTGIGMVTYFGHGGVDVTDLNFGYATDPAKGYANTNKYPILFYNGCGVNNVFSNRFKLFSEAPGSPSFRRPMSLDWLLAADKGAIAVFGNDWDAYATTSNEYLDKLYLEIFPKSDLERRSIGGIIQDVALKTKLEKGYSYDPITNGRVASYYDYDRANIHQIILQGDPALRILVTEGPLPVGLISFNATLAGESKVDVTWKTTWEKNNSHFIVERSYNAKNFEEIGFAEGKGDSNTESTYLFSDTSPLAGTSYYRLKQIDFKGDKASDQKVEYSQIVSVNRPGTSMLVISPNPATDLVEIVLDAPVKIKNWDILNQQGKVFKRAGTGNKVNLANFPAGEYIIKILTENEDIYFKKIVKM